MNKYKITYVHFFRGQWQPGEYTNANEGLTWQQARILQYKLSKSTEFKDVVIKIMEVNNEQANYS